MSSPVRLQSPQSGRRSQRQGYRRTRLNQRAEHIGWPYSRLTRSALFACGRLRAANSLTAVSVSKGFKQLFPDAEESRGPGSRAPSRRRCGETFVAAPPPSATTTLPSHRQPPRLPARRGRLRARRARRETQGSSPRREIAAPPCLRLPPRPHAPLLVSVRCVRTLPQNVGCTSRRNETLPQAAVQLCTFLTRRANSSFARHRCGLASWSSCAPETPLPPYGAGS